MGFGQGTAGAVEAQPARPGHVLVMPSETEVEQHELTHLPFSETGVDTAYVPRVKKAHTMSRVLAACRSSPQTVCSWVWMERQSPFQLVMTD